MALLLLLLLLFLLLFLFFFLPLLLLFVVLAFGDDWIFFVFDGADDDVSSLLPSTVGSDAATKSSPLRFRLWLLLMKGCRLLFSIDNGDTNELVDGEEFIDGGLLC